MEAEVVEPETALSLIPHDAQIMRAPKEVLDGAIEAATALKDVISKKKRPVTFRGEQYLQYEDWQTIAGFFGSSVATGDAELIDIDGVRGFRAKASVIDGNGIEVSRAEAYCMKDEDNWSNKPLFQLASMAQTRAGAKALRNKFAWVAVLAGYSPTPAEEMTGTETNGAPADDVPKCSECSGSMWDNRATKKGNQPDFKCKDKSCNKAIWLNSGTEGFGNESVLRDEFFDKAEKFMIARNFPENKRKDALGRLVAMTTEDMGKAVERLVTGAKPSEEQERQKKLNALIDAKGVTAEMIQEYVNEHFNGTPPEKLSLDALTQMYEDLVIPF